MEQKIKFKLLYESSVLPVKAHETDACYDVFANRIEKKSNHLYICYLGFATEIPQGIKGAVVPRSSQTKTQWAMLNSPGQIDPDFRNEWQVRFTYVGGVDSPEFPFIEGDRVAQIYFERINYFDIQVVNELSETQRGLGGFGSTGR